MGILLHLIQKKLYRQICIPTWEINKIHVQSRCMRQCHPCAKTQYCFIFRSGSGVVWKCRATGQPFSLPFFLHRVKRRWWEGKMLELTIWLRRKSSGSNTSRKRWKPEKKKEEKTSSWSEWRPYRPKLEWSILRVLGGLLTSKYSYILFDAKLNYEFPQTSNEENWASLSSGHIWRNCQKYQRSSQKSEKPGLLSSCQHRSGHTARSLSGNLPGASK